ncbi:FtsP/CotA-like multicopper oxidase with cupredoxin domain [Agromyces flavus]|uniref:FtsP/CotA-like multicopper oxidase with cupredoxin domain n=1 Tax=Agromyces flavus TaxID=589382 RepID=A0A1H1WK36_9MICO|nr:multicopper oxidase family protein [Agromyces flavus]MCP2366176.1 FtsP/CotA-like multicopper oxidase with cupredoxin domain [Agromyces flavus]GGI44152.1 metallo-oxidoreductase [Agromyces flavus]SDS96549.1 Multicopper oxidase with three cupredoxin domains (includes cell division protein FtsP and spore coat protein CotA) [Agromyces flavus]
MPSPRELLRCTVVGVAVATALGAGALAWSSTLLGEYSVMDMGAEAAGGPGAHAHGAAGGTGAAAPSGVVAPSAGIDVTSLKADPERPADVRVELVARQEAFDVPGGRRVQGYTVNGSSPGPEIRATQGDLVEVAFVNESVTDGATLHWHGIDVPNAADGVAGITQDAVPVGGRHVYRFVAEDAGTFWYHSHQVSHEQVVGGLLGAIVIDPAEPPEVRTDVDVTALLHVYGGQHSLNGRIGDERIQAHPGETVRVRVINSDQGTAAVWSAAAYRVLAIDGRDVHAPGEVRDQRLLIPAGGRADVAVRAPADGSAVRLQVGGARSVVIVDPAHPEASAPPARQPKDTLDLLAYGAPAPLDFDPTVPDRSFEYVIARRFGIIDGRPGNFWTINGRMFPDVPMFHVREGDVVGMRIENRSGDVHPMHLHGHHVVVLSRDGVAASGSPWIVDSLDVHPGEAFDIAFVADNPGIWSDHCHTLPHAVDGLVAHVMYEGVTTGFTIDGAAGNRPE